MSDHHEIVPTDGPRRDVVLCSAQDILSKALEFLGPEQLQAVAGKVIDGAMSLELQKKLADQDRLVLRGKMEDAVREVHEAVRAGQCTAKVEMVHRSPDGETRLTVQSRSILARIFG